jgi:Peptidase M15
MALANDLVYFKLSEFKHPELVDAAAAAMLDEVRGRYGKPLVLTSDARTPAENAALPGSSPTSLHLQGRAFDMEWIASAADRYQFVVAVLGTARLYGYQPELEFVLSGAEQHVHLGFYPAGHVGQLELRSA